MLCYMTFPYVKVYKDRKKNYWDSPVALRLNPQIPGYVSLSKASKKITSIEFLHIPWYVRLGIMNFINVWTPRIPVQRLHISSLTYRGGYVRTYTEILAACMQTFLGHCVHFVGLITISLLMVYNYSLMDKTS